MIRKLSTNATLWGAVGLTAASLSDGRQAVGQEFVPTAGTQVWNNNNNWGPGAPQPFPNATGASATILAPTAALTVNLGQPIVLGSLTIQRPLTGTFNTTIAGTATNILTFDGGGSVTTTDSVEGAGTTTISAPVSFNGPLTITQGDDDVFRFTGVLSGSGSVLVQRTTDADQYVAFAAANTYAGSTTVLGNGASAFQVLRLNHANAIPGGIGATGGTSNITLGQSGILGLGSNDFKRSIGTGPDQIQFAAGENNGFSAFGATRIVDLGGAAAPVAWDPANYGELTLGSPTADATVDFKNPLNFTGNASVRAILGTNNAITQGIFSGSITSTAEGGAFTKNGNGTLSLAAANSYSGATFITGGALVPTHPQALPATTNFEISGGVLGLAHGDFTGGFGTGPGQVKFTSNGGFAAYGGNRVVNIGGEGAPVSWGEGALAANLILNWESADGQIEFVNPIDVTGGDRVIGIRNAAPNVDARITGVISGEGGWVKNAAGTVEVSAANTYTGVTNINGGVLLLTNEQSIPGGINGGSTSNILNGAVIGLGHGNFTAPLGSGVGQVQFVADANAGFAAYGGDRVVNLGGAGAPVSWGADGFVTNNFILGWESADSRIEFVNPIDLNNGVRTFAARNGSAAVDSLVSGVISGTGTLNKTQPGTLELTAVNTFDGGVTLRAGRLLANNTTGSAVGSGDVTIFNNGTLGGTGFVGTLSDASNVTVQSGGRISPGVTIGELTISGNVTFAAGSFFDVDLAAASFDKLTINGATTLNGTLNVVVPEGFVATPGSTYEILGATSGVTGQFAAITSNAATPWTAQYGANSVTLVAGSPPGLEADFNLDGFVNGADLQSWKSNFGLATGATKQQGDANGDGAIDGSDFLAWQRQYSGVAPTTATAAAVPEPATLGTSLLALVGGGWLRRRSQRKHLLAARDEQLPRA